jgi:beta-glucosidase
MPFALANKVQAILDNQPDVPGYPAADTLYPFGYGLTY